MPVEALIAEFAIEGFDDDSYRLADAKRRPAKDIPNSEKF